MLWGRFFLFSRTFGRHRRTAEERRRLGLRSCWAAEGQAGPSCRPSTCRLRWTELAVPWVEALRMESAAWRMNIRRIAEEPSVGEMPCRPWNTLRRIVEEPMVPSSPSSNRRRTELEALVEVRVAWASVEATAWHSWTRTSWPVAAAGESSWSSAGGKVPLA